MRASGPSLSLTARLRGLGRPRRFGRKEFLFAAGDPVNGFYAIQTGEVRAFNMDDQGREVEVARLGPGDILAEAVVFVSETFPLFAQAVRETTVLFFEKAKVLREIEEDPRLAREFVMLMAQKCFVLSRRIESLGLQTVRQRLAQYLLSRCSGDRLCQVRLPMTKGELAKLLGTVNETLSRALRQMREEGLIEVEGDLIRIQNCPALRAELK